MFMTIKQAAEYLEVSYFTIYNRIQTGSLKANRIGGVYRIAKEDVENYKIERDEAAQYDKRRVVRK